MVPVSKQINSVWISRVNPIARGWFICMNNILAHKIREYRIFVIISKGSLIKILILEINDKAISFLLKFKKRFS